MKNHMLRAFAKDEDAVSPVVGVILMVAITVILAAIIAAFVLGLGSPKTPPQASLKLVRANSSALCIEHQGGAQLTLSSGITVTVGGSAVGQSWTKASDGSTTKTSLSAGEATDLFPGTVAANNEVRLLDNASNQQIGSFTVGTLNTGALTCP